MTTLINMSRFRLYNTQIIKRSLSIHLVPYNEQYESRDNENEIRRKENYGKWIEVNKGKINKIDRQVEIKESLDKFYSPTTIN